MVSLSQLPGPALAEADGRVAGRANNPPFAIKSKSLIMLQALKRGSAMLKAVVALAASMLVPCASLQATQSNASQPQAPAARTLDVPAGNSWQHAETSLVLPPRLADLRRVSIRDLGQDELDIVATYQGDDGTVATVYLFKSGLPNPSIWFDRALFAVRARLGGRTGTAAPGC